MNRPVDPPQAGSPGRWFWTGFFTVLLSGVLVALFALLRGGQHWAEEQLADSPLPAQVNDAIRITLAGGEALYIDPDRLPEIQNRLREQAARGREQAERALSRVLTDGLEPAFDRALERVPAFADWYYSLGGEYTRLLSAAFGDLGELLAEQAEALIFRPAGSTAAIDTLVARLHADSAAHLNSAAGELRTRLLELAREHSLEPGAVEFRISGRLDLATSLGEIMEPYLSPTGTDLVRQGLATSGGAAASAAAMKKLGGTVVAKASAKIGSQTALGTLAGLASKLGIKSAAKAGGTLSGAGAGAAGGAALCTGTVLGAPLAPGCAILGGVVSGVAVWLLVDQAVIEADEYLHRSDLEDQLRQAITAGRDALAVTLQEHYVAGTGSALGLLADKLDHSLRPTPVTPRKDFIPARAMDH